MRIAIVSSGGGWHVRDVVRAATDRGHETVVVPFSHLVSEIVQGEIRTAATDRNSDQVVSLQSIDCLLVRTMPAGSLEQVIFRMDVLHALQDSGIHVINSPRCLETAIDKYVSLIRMSRAHLLVPDTIACERWEDAMSAFETLGCDVVAKPLFGSEGKGMVRVRDSETAYRVFRAWFQLGAICYVQRFMPHDSDLRGFVIGGRVIAGLSRANRSDWRTNASQGGATTVTNLSPEEERVVLEATRAVGAEIAAVDLLPRGDQSPRVLEVNAVPGWRQLAKVSELDIATSVVEHLESLVGSGTERVVASSESSTSLSTGRPGDAR